MEKLDLDNLTPLTRHALPTDMAPLTRQEQDSEPVRYWILGDLFPRMRRAYGTASQVNAYEGTPRPCTRQQYLEYSRAGVPEITALPAPH
jgi:hypothetical protein